MQAPELLSSHNVLRSMDRAESEAVLSRDLCPHVLRPGDPARLCTVQNRVHLPSSALLFVRYGTRVRVANARTADAYIVVVPQSGRGNVRIGPRETGISPCRGAIIEPDTSFLIEADSDTAALVWRVERSALQRLAQIVSTRAHAAAPFAPLLDLHRGAGAGFSRTMRFVAQELNGVQRAGAKRLALGHLEQALMFTLLDMQMDGSEPERAGSRPGSAPACVRRAEEYLAVHVAEGAGTEDLIRVSGVCGRTLFRRFKAFHGVSPQRYLRLLRLHGVRSELTRSEPEVSVTVVLSRWGITQFGRFATEYRQRFGELPSQTLRGTGLA